jgi:hypothetical protein
MDCLEFSSFISVYLCSSVDTFQPSQLWRCQKKSAASAPSQGVVLGWRRSAPLHDGATGGDERRHIASALHRGSEGAQAILLNPLLACLFLQATPQAAFDQSLQSR